MKYRADFVTNSSSSSFVIVKIRLRSGEELKVDFNEMQDSPRGAQELVGATTLEELIQKLTLSINALLEANYRDDDDPENPCYLQRDLFIGALMQEAKTIDDVDTIVWEAGYCSYGSDLGYFLGPLLEISLRAVSVDDPGYRAEFERVKAEVLQLEDYSAIADEIVNHKVAAALATGDLWELMLDKSLSTRAEQTIIEVASGKVIKRTDLRGD